jgi:hypothetical protein
MSSGKHKLSWHTRGLAAAPIVLVLFASLIWAGCSSRPKAPPPLERPGVSATVAYHAGAPLARPTTRAVNPSDDALAVQVTWSALERVPDGLAGVTPTARLIAVPTSTQPIATSGALIGGVRFVSPDQVDQFVTHLQTGKYGRLAEIAEVRAALPADVTAVFDLGEAPSAPDHRRIALSVYRLASTGPGSEAQPALMINDPPLRERALLDPIALQDMTKFAVVVPTHFSGSQSTATLALVEISRQTGAEHEQAMAQCIAELAAPPAGTTLPAAAPADWPGLAAALQVIQTQPRTARSALVFLAQQTGASLCGDVALVADDATIASLASRIAAKGEAAAPIEKSKLGWMLDSACFEELAALQSTDKMPPELSAVLTAYAGEAGRHASSLDEVAKGLQSREQLDARLLAENMVYLEDASPAARVRAFDWLATQGRAPVGYDPLGPSKERRAALDKAMSAAATNSGGTK